MPSTTPLSAPETGPATPRPALLLALALLVLAGCFQPPPPIPKVHTIAVLLDSGVEPETRLTHQYYLVVLSGGETLERIRGGDGDPFFQCPRSKPFTYDEETERLRYDGTQGTVAVANLTIVVAIDYRGTQIDGSGVREGCLGLPRLLPFYGRAAFDEWLRPDLRTEFEVEAPNGLLTYGREHFAPVGKKVHVNLTRIESTPHATYVIRGDFDLVNLGAWEKSNLTGPGWNLRRT